MLQVTHKVLKFPKLYPQCTECCINKKGHSVSKVIAFSLCTFKPMWLSTSPFATKMHCPVYLRKLLLPHCWRDRLSEEGFPGPFRSRATYTFLSPPVTSILTSDWLRFQNFQELFFFVEGRILGGCF